LEAQCTDPNAKDLGSIAGGGRYDQLVSRFIPSQQFPCVGASVGFERVFSYLANKHGIGTGVSTKVLIVEVTSKTKKESQDKPVLSMGLYKERLQLLHEIRNIGNITAEIVNKISPYFDNQIDYCEDREIKFMVIIGEDEVKSNTVNLRCLPLINDVVIMKDNVKGQIIGILHEDIIRTRGGKIDANLFGFKEIKKSKFPRPVIQILNDQNQITDQKRIIDKKDISKIVCNDTTIIDLQIKGLKRDELIPLLSKCLAK